MKRNCLLHPCFLFILFLAPNVAFADVLDLHISVSRPVWGPGDQIELYGGLYTMPGIGTSLIAVPNASISILIINSSGAAVSNYTLNASAYGLFYSNSQYHNGTVIFAPNSTGNYTIEATYEDAGGTSYRASAYIYITSASVDEIRVFTNSPIYYPGTPMQITAEAIRISGEYRLPVANISINGTIRDNSETILSGFSCITGSEGRCSVSETAPSNAGNYFVEANGFSGYASFRVVPFEVDVYIKDDTGSNLKQTFYPGQTGYVEVRVSYNGSSPNPSDEFTANGNIYDASGNLISPITSFSLNSNNSYVNRAQFTTGTGASSGAYVARMTVSKTGDGTVNGSAWYQIRQWELSVSKTGTNNGFEAGYTAFRNATVYFKADATYLSNGTTFTGLEGRINISLKNYIGEEVGNSTATYNSTLDDYLFNLSLPNTVGAYLLHVAANAGGETQTAILSITVTGTSAALTPSNAEGIKKEVFTSSEFVYLKVSAKNATSSANITDAELVSIIYEDGTQMNYSAADCSALNATDSSLTWCWNRNKTSIQLDSPNRGGLFSAQAYANNRSLTASGNFMIKPYAACVSPKASESLNSANDYYWQFQTSDTVYLLITLTYTQDTTGMTTNSSSSGNGSMGGGGSYSYASYGMGSGCSIGNTESPVENATLSINRVVNTQSGKSEALNTSTSVCKSTTLGSGKAAYICILKPADNKWDGGRYYAVIDIAGPGGTIRDKGYGMFEARSFYLYGWSGSWQNKPNSNLNFTIYMYSGGGGGWFSGGATGGLSGTIKLEKIRYLGTGWGGWITPVDYDYNTQGMADSTITSGIGNITLNASRAPGGSWNSGMYSAVIKGTRSDTGDVDYGEIWFEIRNWYAWAQLVDISSSPYQQKWQSNTKENVTLYVKISNAGDMWNSYGQALGGNVTVRVKKIEYSTTWPPKELPAANYTATAITANASNCDVWNLYSCGGVDASKYVINISSTSGRWASGYYNVMLDINGTETGWGWFSALAFYINTQPVDINGTYTYSSRGNGPVYLNVTATKGQNYYSSSYSSKDYVNTTFEDLTLHRWDSSSGSYRQVDLNYPENINVSIVGRSGLNLSGANMLNITLLNSSSWPSGYYYGELVLRDNESSSVTGYIWFGVEPFRVDLQASQYEIMQNDEINATLNIYEPGWTWPYTPIPGNYTIDSVVLRTWTYGGETIQILNKLPSSFNGSNTTLTVYPPGGSWSNGWKSLTVTVRDNSSNATKDGWLSFKVTPFRINVQRASGESYTTGILSNVTVQVNLTHPRTGEAKSGNLSAVYKWSGPSKTYYSFKAGNCTSASSTIPCTINGAQNVTIIPPERGWDEGYNYLQFIFTTTGDATPIDDWSSIYFEARQKISGYMYAVDSNGNYLWAASNTSNITMYLYSIQNMTWNPMAVNATKVEYYRSSGYWVEENSRTYTELPSSKWFVVNITTGQATGNNEINSNGYLRLAPPSGSAWENGEYYIRITVGTGSDSGIIKNGWFRIKDMTPISLVVNSPQNYSTINASFILFNATTSKTATCSVNIMGNGSTGYYAYLSQYGGYGYGNGSNSSSITTGGMAHIFNHSTSGMPDQSYTAWFYCNDYDYNYVNAMVPFTLNVSGGASGNQSNQTNITVIPSVTSVLLAPASPTNSSTLRCNATVANTTEQYAKINVTWYRNNAVFDNTYLSSIPNATNTEVSNISSANLTVNDVWKCSVRATNNYINYSAWANSSNVTINSDAGAQAAPWYGAALKNSSSAGNTTLFYAEWYDSANLSGYIFSFDNGAGTFSNDSWAPFSGTYNWSNVTKTLNSTIGALIRWRIYANNSNSLWNSTLQIAFNTTG